MTLYAGKGADMEEAEPIKKVDKLSSPKEDFVIKDGVLTEYLGEGGDVIIPDGVKSIGKYVFRKCEGLTGITIPEGVVSIGDCAFDDCKNLKSVTMPDSLNRIEHKAFRGCSGLESLTIPGRVNHFGEDAFADCVGLKSVYYNGDIADWCKITFTNVSANPVWFAKQLFRRNKLVTDLVIPEGIQTINDYVFCGCESIVSIIIDNSVKTIGRYAFADCKNLESLELRYGVEYIGEYSFSNCKSLNSLTIPRSVSNISDGAFIGHGKIQVTMPKWYQGHEKRIFGTKYFGPFSKIKIKRI